MDALLDHFLMWSKNKWQQLGLGQSPQKHISDLNILMWTWSQSQYFHLVLNFYGNPGRTIQQIETSAMGNLVPHHHKSGRTEPLIGENWQWFFIIWPNKSSPNPCPSLHLIIHFLRPRLKPLPQWPKSYSFSLSPLPEMLFLCNLPMTSFLFSFDWLWANIQSNLSCRKSAPSPNSHSFKPRLRLQQTCTQSHEVQQWCQKNRWARGGVSLWQPGK